MRRDHFTLTTSTFDSDDTDGSSLIVEYDGPKETLTSQLTDDSTDLNTADDIDAAFRLQEPLDEDDATGVFSLTHRITGEYLLEANADADTILTLIRNARDTTDDDASYRIRIERKDGDTIVYDLDALFVYDTEGSLLRKNSLIPSGVEL